MHIIKGTFSIHDVWIKDRETLAKVRAAIEEALLDHGFTNVSVDAQYQKPYRPMTDEEFKNLKENL